MGIGYPRVPAGFKNIHGYFLNGYPIGKQAVNKWIFFFAGRVAGRHYPCPTRPVAIPIREYPFIIFIFYPLQALSVDCLTIQIFCTSRSQQSKDIRLI